MSAISDENASPIFILRVLVSPEPIHTIWTLMNSLSVRGRFNSITMAIFQIENTLTFSTAMHSSEQQL